MTKRKAPALADLEKQQQDIAEKIRLQKERVAVSYGTPFVERFGDSADPKTIARLAGAAATVGLDEAVRRLT